MTDPSPEGSGGVSATARVDLLAAAVGNHVLMQGRVPVVVAYHATTLPLVIGEKEPVTLLRHILHLHVQDEKMSSGLSENVYQTGRTSPWMVFHASLRPALLSVLYSTKPSFRSRLAFSLTCSDGEGEEDDVMSPHTHTHTHTRRIFLCTVLPCWCRQRTG